MDILSLLISVLVGGVVAAGAWALHRSRLAHAQATLAERLRNSEIQIQGLRDELDHIKGGHTQLLGRVQVEVERRSAAEARADAAERLASERAAALGQVQTEASRMGARIAELETQRTQQARSFEEQKALLAQAEQKLTDTFTALSAKALESNRESFLTLANSKFEKLQEQAKGDLEKRELAVDALVKPISESLERVQKQVGEIEKSRIESFASLTEQVRGMSAVQLGLQQETANLANALGKTGARGRWGEMHLERVLEMVGMREGIDFQKQASVDGENGKLRPDVTIRLPGGKCIVVDAKAPMDAYMESLEAVDEKTRYDCLGRHATAVRNHIAALKGKGYADHLTDALEFVVLFLPGEMLFSAALEADKGLIEFASKRKVILATPTTLFGLLQAVAYSVRQEQIAENAKQISDLGQELYDRVQKFAEHFDRVRTHLQGAVKSYNDAAGSLESRILVSVRRFRELGATSQEDIDPAKGIDRTVRALRAAELTPGLLTPPDSDRSLQA